MNRVDVALLAEKMNRAGVPGDFGPDMSRLLNHMWQEVAKGKPVTRQRIDEIVDGLKILSAEAEVFLRKMAERNENDDIIGILGLSQDITWAHRLDVNGVSLRTWCAWDQLFLAQVLHQTVRGRSTSPVSREQIDITISPYGVIECNPKTTVVSIITLDPDRHDKSKLEELWSGL
jgi:alkylmercury lyase